MTLGDRLHAVESHLQSLLNEVHQVCEELADQESDHDDNPSS